MALKIIASMCTGCSACEPECPNVAIREKGGTFIIDPAKCTSAKTSSTRRSASRSAPWTTASRKSDQAHPAAPAASLQAALGRRPSPSAGNNGAPLLSGLSPLKGAAPSGPA